MPKEFIDEKTTDMPYYDGMIQDPKYYWKEKGKKYRILMVDRNSFESLLADGFGVPQAEIPLRLSSSHIEKYKHAMLGGEKFPIPVLEYSVSWVDFFGKKKEKPTAHFSEEGHHRVVAAIQAGMEKVPVMIVLPVEYEDFKVLKKSGIMRGYEWLWKVSSPWDVEED